MRGERLFLVKKKEWRSPDLKNNNNNKAYPLFIKPSLVSGQMDQKPRQERTPAAVPPEPGEHMGRGCVARGWEQEQKCCGTRTTLRPDSL